MGRPSAFDAYPSIPYNHQLATGWPEPSRAGEMNSQYELMTLFKDGGCYDPITVVLYLVLSLAGLAVYAASFPKD